MRILITGGAGFIGSALVRRLSHDAAAELLVVDALTYAASIDAIAAARRTGHCRFVHGDIRDGALLTRLFDSFRPNAVVHLAAESHVDRSLRAPDDFITTNVLGTFQLLSAARGYWARLPAAAAAAFRLLNVSTDEVFGALGEQGRFDETSPVEPRSPYSASKAGADHLVAAWGHSYGLPVLQTHCSNNYGPWQHPEKLIPLTIVRALRGAAIPVYGAGEQVRDWLHVDDHVDALLQVLARGVPGRRYLIGGDTERRNLSIVRELCAILDGMAPRPGAAPHAAAIAFVADRPGHDFRYAIDAGLIRSELGWSPRRGLADGLASTVRWYLDHRDWWQPIASAAPPLWDAVHPGV
ncbi:dTDP-glucose 4,6-dehydratase [Sphingomonas yunnanensis]|uniref:dTDP-glucose 4,6-dehydratase n=1 Tax=Sphingomonas yunnanensis TaxID=310400 RepID=UPI001CA6FF46|nr:dTDP-glucose 4,6-dehydratase [Sphingomonas yunnanensis]MBY9063475.1 dTDP-glucose 4,6-dehydratase [Sphingomonas yunnanensis]